MDTVIPKMPVPELSEPDDSKYHLSVVDLDDQVEKLMEEIKTKRADFHSKRNEMQDGQ